MKVVVDNSRALSNTIVVRRVSATKLKSMGAAPANTERDLGVDFAAGRVRGKPVAKQRVATVIARRARMSTLKCGRPRRKTLGA
eukprot:1912048-Pyramimonas_sp.AAC.1